MSYRVPFCRPYFGEKEARYVAEALIDRQLAGDGPFTRRCETLMEEAFDAHRVLLTTSGTAALEMAALLCDLEPHAEVVMPSYTFASTANAFVLRGAKPVFVDIRPDTLNLDASMAEAAITPRTRAIVPVHYAGVSCEMSAIGSLAAKHGLMIVEDAAQGVNARYEGKPLGTIGHIGAYSFHQTKNFACGEGGALVCNEPKLAERAEIIREKGTDRARFFRGQVDKYTWLEAGSSYVPSDLVAAVLLAQLEARVQITAERKRVYELYEYLLQPLVARSLLSLPTIPDNCQPNYHMMYVTVADAALRTALLEHLTGKGYLAVFHYVPLHTSPMGARLGYRRGMLPVTESLSERLIRLPLYPDLDEATVHAIVVEIARFFSVSVRVTAA